MSDNSRVYAYILWSIVVLVTLLAACGRWTQDSFVDAQWARWAIRRKTWRRWRKTPKSLPSNAHLLTLLTIVAVTMILCFVGPDYISPGSKLLRLSTRAVTDLRQKHTISKAFWTAGGRTGIISFALFPLAVALALKAGPITLLTKIHFDKMAFLHKWVSMLVYLVTVLHVVLWSVQLSRDTRGGASTDVAYTYVWSSDRFVLGWIAFGLFTMVVILSVGPLRNANYDAFYMLHVGLVPLTLVFAGLHHPPMIAWTGVALAMWACERLVRGGLFMYVNGILGGMSRPGRHAPRILAGSPAESWDMKVRSPIPERQHVGVPVGMSSSVSPTLATFPPVTPPPFTSSNSTTTITRSSYIPPPGFAHAELLSGSTIRLTFISPRDVGWHVGQYFLLGIPSVSLLGTHPFTCSSIRDGSSASDADRAMIFLVRTRTGWTKELYDLVTNLVAQRQTHAEGEMSPRGSDRPTHGVLLRMYVQGPFGSVERTKFGRYSTVLIFAGGSGVSFGLALLEYVCLCISGRDGKQLGGSSGGWGMKGYNTTRVRFVWLLREFAHTQWCAAALHRCMSLLPAANLEISIFVTNSTPHPRRGPNVSHTKNGALAPPGLSRSASNASQESNLSDDEDPDVEDETSDVLGGYYGKYGDEEIAAPETLTGPRPNYILDLTNWAGESEKHLPGEQRLSRIVQTVGRRKRTHSRRMSEFVMPTEILEDEPSSASSPPSSSSFLNPQARNGQRTVAKPSPLSQPPSMRPQLSVVPPSPEVQFNPHARNGRRTVALTSPINQTPSPRPQWLSVPSSIAALDEISTPVSALSRNNSSNSQNGNWDGREDIGARSGLVSVEARLRLEVEEQEMRDISAVAVNARAGKPKLDKILADEVARSTGRVVVACCGPSSLSATVRRTVANQIDTTRIWQGDMRGSITMVAEEFEY